MDWNMELHKTAAVAALSYVSNFSPIIQNIKMATICLPFLCLCPAQKRTAKHLLQDEEFCITFASLIPDTVSSSFSWHKTCLTNKFQPVFNTEILEPAKWDHKHVFLSQELPLASCLTEFTRILMADCAKKRKLDIVSSLRFLVCCTALALRQQLDPNSSYLTKFSQDLKTRQQYRPLWSSQAEGCKILVILNIVWY